MLLLLDTSDDLTTCALDSGYETALLLTPLTYRADRGCRYAIDNGAFAGFKRSAFRSLLERQMPHRERCLFVVAPDVVGSARRTLELFDYWYPRLDKWPVALAIQDGQEDLPIPWEFITAIFIGGTTSFKLSAVARHIVLAAKAMDKWVHVGRVNDANRLDLFSSLGADSIDGTGLARFTHMRNKLRNPFPLLDGTP